MTASDKTTLVNALTSLKLKYQVGDGINRRIDKLISDLDAIQLGAGGVSSQFFAGTLQVDPVTTVAALPTNPPPVLNDEAIVTDSTVATNGGTVAGGSANRVLVRYNGTNWIIV